MRSLEEVDETKGTLYFSGTEHSFIANHAYSINLDGSGLKRLTQTEGNHRASFNSGASHFIDSWNDVNTPTQVRLYDSAGTLVRAIDENKVDALKQYKLGKVEFMNVKTRDGFTMEAMMIKPPDFDPKKKYPVWSYTYSGPQAQSVRNAWGGARVHVASDAGAEGLHHLDLRQPHGQQQGRQLSLAALQEFRRTGVARSRGWICMAEEPALR